MGTVIRAGDHDQEKRDDTSKKRFNINLVLTIIVIIVAVLALILGFFQLKQSHKISRIEVQLLRQQETNHMLSFRLGNLENQVMLLENTNKELSKKIHSLSTPPQP